MQQTSPPKRPTSAPHGPPLAATDRLLTADEFMELSPELAKNYELVRGELVEVPMTGYEHAEIETNILFLLAQHVRQYRLGQITPGDAMFVLERDPDTLRQPDVAFVRADRLPPRDQRRSYSPVAPDLAIEVLSPSNRPEEVTAKVAEYLRAGVHLVPRQA